MPQFTQLVSGELGSLQSTRVPCDMVSLYETPEEYRPVSNKWFGCPAKGVASERR